MPLRTAKKTKSEAKVDGVFQVGDQVHIGSSDRPYTVVAVGNQGCDITMDRNDGKRPGALCNVADVRHVGHLWVPKERIVPKVTSCQNQKNTLAVAATAAVTPTATTSARTTVPVASTPPASKLKSKLMAAAQIQNQAPHLIIKARAGTGKTTTIVQGIKAAILGQPTPFKPSPQQATIWEYFAQSKGIISICICAFNNSIARVLKEQVPAGVDAMTMHSLGYRAIRAAYSNLKTGNEAVNRYRVNDILARLTGTDIRELRSMQPVAVNAINDLTGLVKCNLAGTDTLSNGRITPWKPDDERWVEVLSTLASHYQVELETDDGESVVDMVFEAVPQVIQECMNVSRDRCVDYNDMVWIPIVCGLPVQRYDVLMVDESQDLNRVQQALAKRAGKRLVFMGDDKQAIYAFAGADSRSLERLEEELRATPNGVVTLPLTMTRRCPKAVVDSVKHLVPDFEALPEAPQGSVVDALYTMDEDEEEVPFEQTYLTQVQDGDLVLCRVNAPCVGQCIKLIRRGIPAYVAGQDVGKGLVKLVKKMKASNTVELVENLDTWHFNQVEQEQAKRNPDESLLIKIGDQVATLMVFIKESHTVDEVIARINKVIKDKVCPRCAKSCDAEMEDCPTCKVRLVKPKGVRFSSIHKAKGLEAEQVFLLQIKGAQCPHPMAKTPEAIAQEYNLLYVAHTRAKDRLVIVTNKRSLKPAAERRRGW